MRSILLLVLLITCSRVAPAQPVLPVENGARTNVAVDTPSTGAVHVDADPRIERLMSTYSEHKHVQRGYRVQIFLGDRKTAEETKRAFLQKNPEVPAYISWLAPNFRLRVGDLRTRLEAERLLRDMKLQYPGSYIVPDEIEMPLLPEQH
jgi:hypothetical protein